MVDGGEAGSIPARPTSKRGRSARAERMVHMDRITAAINEYNEHTAACPTGRWITDPDRHAAGCEIGSRLLREIADVANDRR